MNRFYKRYIYDNFFRPSRLPLYDSMMKKAIDKGYEFCSIIEFWHLIENNAIDPLKKYCIIRHDIDTDPKTAYQMFLIEKKYGIHSTYYYRLNTLDEKAMDEMCDFGTEVGYHYENIGSIALNKRLKTLHAVDENLDLIRRDFANHYQFFKSIWGGVSCASHGDFIVANYLKTQNRYLLNDELRRELQIELEAYDEELMGPVTCRIADLGRIDGLWTPIGYNEAIDNEEKVLYVLVHPRQWHSRVWCNIKSDFERVIDTIKYKYL